jgi:hypothetical protein
VTDRLTLTQAIDLAGPILFGADWIDRLTVSEAELLTKFGPKPRGQPNQTISPCPRRLKDKLDRVIGRDHRLAVQRATVLDWIYAAGILIGRNYCDISAIKRGLARSRPEKSVRGAPPVVRQKLTRRMLEDIRAGSISGSSLGKLKQEALAEMYSASRKACKEARIDALAEAERQGLV